MKKDEFIARYGEEAWASMLEESRTRAHAWKKANPEKVIVQSQERNRKGGRNYENHKVDNKTGLQGKKNRIRRSHAREYQPFKMIIAPDSQLHHEWIPKTANYRGVALVEKDPHQYGIIDVIQILDGEITLLTEEEVRNGQEAKAKEEGVK